jgi:hypothetical protein
MIDATFSILARAAIVICWTTLCERFLVTIVVRPQTLPKENSMKQTVVNPLCLV